MRIQVGNT